ncbi:MAG TPA: 23S rRNA (adenine(2503)-C(2))-methyltransferase RlmN, partial [bacterium]|nr:23S rRNA (adenine(2503)-C(2))-methyltransferase RlmN [bacterium]
MNPKQNIKSLSLQDLQNELKTLGLEGYRASQVKRWLYKFDVDSFAKMTNIAGKFREILKEQFDLLRLPVVKMQLSKDGTKKYLLQLEDGHCVEVVLIPADGRNTLCVSTQVGCGMCCAFCLTGTMGLIRNLTQFEILEQVSAIRRTLAEGERITNLVFMGMGEPLANTASLYPAIDILLD